MSLPPPQYRFETPLIHISAWDDPIVDQLGHDPRSPYVEQFWLPILGPSTTFLMRHLSARLDEEPEGFDLSVDDTARLLGLGTRSGLGSPFIRAMARTGQFRLTRPCGPDAIEVRRKLPGLSSPQISRLPAPVRDAHDGWQRAANKEPTSSSAAPGLAGSPSACSSSVRTPRPRSSSSTAGASTRRWPTRRCAGPRSAA